jgi:GGDEF domain-containing protein
MVIVGGIIQMLFFPYIPIFCFTCLIVMLIFYIQSIELRISLDSLTNLNNRGQLNRYISQSSSLHQDGRLTIVIMIDIDNFKEINDIYGHAEGDNALIIVSESI